MLDKFPALDSNIDKNELERLSNAKEALASAFHGLWQKNNTKPDGTYIRIYQNTFDKKWIWDNKRSRAKSARVDIVSSSYKELPPDLRKMFLSDSEDVMGIILKNGLEANEADERAINSLGEQLHSAWLKRNPGEPKTLFTELDDETQIMYVEKYKLATQLLNPNLVIREESYEVERIQGDKILPRGTHAYNVYGDDIVDSPDKVYSEYTNRLEW